MKKWRRFVNTIAPLPMQERQSLPNLQMCRAFIAKSQVITSKKVYTAIGN
jgi:hypothetical protein